MLPMSTDVLISYMWRHDFRSAPKLKNRPIGFQRSAVTDHGTMHAPGHQAKKLLGFPVARIEKIGCPGGGDTVVGLGGFVKLGSRFSVEAQRSPCLHVLWYKHGRPAREAGHVYRRGLMRFDYDC